MADTLAEIYRNTLTSSDFDSNGEATIVTTNSSTSHVIKNIQVSDTDTQIPVNGALKINDFDIVGLTGNSSGSEIIAPSSTVKVKSSAMPLTYLDYDIALRTTNTNYVSHIEATVNDISVISNIYDGTNSIPFSLAQNETRDIYAPNLGANNYHLIILDNQNNNTNGYLYNSSGSAVWSNTDSYAPKWFDGKQYAYWFNDSGTSGIDRVDCYTGTVTRLVDVSLANGYTYPKMYGYRNEYLWFWSRYDSDTPHVYNFATGQVSSWADSTAQNRLTQTDKNYFVVKRSDGKYRQVIPNQGNEFVYFEWDASTFVTGSNQLTFNTLNLSGNAEGISDRNHNMAVVGSKLYYINDNSKLAYVDFAPDTPTKAEVGTNTVSVNYGTDLQQVERTPDSSTISGRSGYPNPSLKLRVTGITST